MKGRGEEALWQRAADDGIDVTVRGDLPTAADALYLSARPDAPVAVRRLPARIVLRTRLSPARRSAALATALGHHFTGASDLLGVTAREAQRRQYRARKWAAQCLLPLEAIAEAYLAQDANIFAMAEALEVGVDTLEAAIALYGQVYGGGVRLQGYEIVFEPYFFVTARM